MEQIKIKLDGGMMPKKATPFDAAYDVYVPKDTDIKKGGQIIDLGFCMELPHGYGALMRSRSGYAAKGIPAKAVNYVNEVVDVRVDAVVRTGLIDERYRNHVGVLLYVANMPDGFYSRIYLPKGLRVAQMQIPDTELVETDELDMTDDRGGGFGHTNLKQ